MKAVSRTHIGKVRPSNQDALLTQPGAFGLFGVADGMGGHKAGDIASRMAVELVGEALADQRPTEDLLRAAIENANEEIFEAQLEDASLQGMGTTMTVIWEDTDRVLLGHVGDSRAYLLRDGAICQVSQDHSMVAELVRDGQLTEEEARHHPYRNIITRAVGTSFTVQVDVTVLNKRPGDVYLLCSDGLSEYVLPETMRQILMSRTLDDAADTLIQLALDGGGRDNVSVVLAEVTA